MSSGICCSWCTAGCVPGVQRQPMFLGPRQVGRGMPDACSTCLSNCIWSEDRRMVLCYSFSSCWSSASTTTGQLSCSGWCTCQYYRRGCRLVGGTASNAPLNVTFVHVCQSQYVPNCGTVHTALCAGALHDHVWRVCLTKPRCHVRRVNSEPVKLYKARTMRDLLGGWHCKCWAQTLLFDEGFRQ